MHMEKGKGRFLVFCLIIVFGLGFVGEVRAIDLLDGKLRLHGFLKNETGIRLKERVWHDPILAAAPAPFIYPSENARAEEHKLSVMRSTLLIDGEYDITEDLRFGFIFRGYYDAKWDLDSSIDYVAERTEGDLRAEPDGEYLEADVDLREYHLLWTMGNFRIKAGRQQIVWGEADAIRISDIINPLDFSKDYTTTAYGYDWEDVRIPQRMIDIIYVVPESPQQVELEFVLNPEDTRVHTYAPYGELYYGPPGNMSLIGTGDLLTNYFPFGALGRPPFPPYTLKSMNKALGDAIDDANPDSNSASFSGGMRLRAVLGGWDTHLFYYYQRAQNPVFTSSGNFSHLILPFPWDVYDENLGVKAHFPHKNTIGATVNYFHDLSGTVFRGEFGYTIDQPYSGLRQGVVTDPASPDFGKAWDGWFNDSVVYKDTITYMLGFDRPTWIPFLNETNTFFITGQFVHKFILDYNDENAGKNNKLLLSTTMGKDGFSDHQTLVSLVINTKYYDDRIKPDVLVVWDINGHNGYVRPALRWAPTYDWMLEVGALYFWADSYTCGPFGPVKDDDQIYCSIEWRF